MIGDLFGNISDKQEQLKQQLDEIKFSHSGAEGAILIEMTASKKITDIQIDFSRLDLTDSAELEDLLLVTLNESLLKADQLAAEKTKSLLNEMLPPGLGNMFGA